MEYSALLSVLDPPLKVGVHNTQRLVVVVSLKTRLCMDEAQASSHQLVPMPRPLDLAKFTCWPGHIRLLANLELLPRCQAGHELGTGNPHMFKTICWLLMCLLSRKAVLPLSDQGIVNTFVRVLSF
ncbi:hypothetical protein J3459_007881 [Metarhizium acridum]|uniref:uncharacterized protein n=1 Tax=Metarhizium acridum TaxID=92637 RepID=UPI001C6D13B5|nr:hypothetical protein J3458_019019 [Metarhizium acridum]KAG8426676.1 hypothetical protein J3459_007918 [Metarhizium acridum]KAG8426705.1 hypothetical protein J3459_007881 [Metarhizium acridum]